MFLPRLLLRNLILTLAAVALTLLLLFAFSVRNVIVWESAQIQHQVTPTMESSKQKLTTENSKLKPSIDLTKPWYFLNGGKYPVSLPNQNVNQSLSLFPEDDSNSDRIINQLMYVPPNYESIQATGHLKTILLYNGPEAWNVTLGRDLFRNLKCPVNTCQITADRSRAVLADLIIYRDGYSATGMKKRKKQLYMLYTVENPHNTGYVQTPDIFNWTATYRRDSDIVVPYGKWVYYNSTVRQKTQKKNYAFNKSKKVAWLVSSCDSKNRRWGYVRELQKYIQVDIYGKCGSHKCSPHECFDKFERDYKFYLAFENANCKDYITEELFENALKRDILPVVMGARQEDYEASAPTGSYIHVDENTSPAILARRLKILDRNNELYNSYFKWKGTGEFINTYFWCRVCAALHDEKSLKISGFYTDINEWWRGVGICE